MCLGIPGRVVGIVDGYAGQVALVDVEGAQRQVNVGMLDEQPPPGQWVLIHMGFAVEAVDEEQARTAMSGLQLMGSGRASRVRRRYDVFGLVQGVGFRPFVYVTASELGLAGSVSNTSSGVVVEVEGDPDAVDSFGRRLADDAPPLAEVQGVHESELPVRGGTAFTIEHSTKENSADGGGRTLASPDVAICDDCLAELSDPTNRRYRHPFITCTNCGPRFTIITALPYDRATTTMRDFAMCDACRAEYDDPGDRRFHAQPVACPDCGPTLRLEGPMSKQPGTTPYDVRESCSPRAGSSRSRASAATTSRATPATTRRWPSCVAASAVATSRSRSWHATSTSPGPSCTSTSSRSGC